MSRNRWRLSRALRVLLACLALWLPARSASASFAPADAVVMIGGSAASTGAGESRAARSNPQRAAPRDATSARGVMTRLSLVHGRKNLPVRPPTNASCAVAPPLYLLHCALLR